MNTTWIPITSDTIDTYLLPAQLSALRQNSDPLNEIIADTIARVRSEIHSNPNNPSCPDPSLIPHSLKTATCHLIIEALQSRIPSLKLSDDQVRNANNARTFLKRIATAEIAIDTPNASTESASKISLASKRPRQFSFKTLIGL